MTRVKSWFSTEIYSAPLQNGNLKRFNRELLEEIQKIRAIDKKGKDWSNKNYANGYTSYSSFDRLHEMSSTFGKLKERIDRHVRAYVRALEYDVQGIPPEMTACWANVMPRWAHHSLHLHPLSFISGTYYVSTPPGSGSLKFEDPRLSCFMGAPPRRRNCQTRHRPFIEYPATEGNVVLFESWLRHEVPAHDGAADRVSISFNYTWG